MLYIFILVDKCTLHIYFWIKGISNCIKRIIAELKKISLQKTKHSNLIFWYYRVVVRKDLSQQKIRRYVEAFQGQEENSNSHKKTSNDLKENQAVTSDLPKLMVTEANEPPSDPLKTSQTPSGLLHEGTASTQSASHMAHMDIPQVCVEPSRPGLQSLEQEVPMFRKASGHGWKILRSIPLQRLQVQTSQAIHSDKDKARTQSSSHMTFLDIPQVYGEPYRSGLQSLEQKVPVVTKDSGRGWEILRSIPLQRLQAQNSQTIHIDEEEEIHHV